VSAVLIWTLCGVVVVAAFAGLILAPALGSYRQGWEKAAAGFLSVLVLVALSVIGFALGLLVFLNWDRIAATF
jgi:hypothetical protein